jgi:NAD(P)-dependent dehydrogenase (short-subunit alcohol dehydrogenase family)
VAIRGARILIFGATLPPGRRLVEAYLALGAEVVAADALRTRLEELRAEMGQHERLWVAESGGAAGMEALFADVARDEPIDVAVLVAERATAASVEPLLACCAGRLAERARILVVIVGEDAAQAKLGPSLEAAGALGLCVPVDGATGAGLQQLVELSDPERAHAAGWLGAAMITER